MSQLIAYETEIGLILIDGNNVIEGYALDKGRIDELYMQIVNKAKSLGADLIKVSSKRGMDIMKNSGLSISFITKDELNSLDSNKISLIVKAGLAKNEAEAIEMIREKSILAAEEAIRVASSRQDLQIVQAIQALDDLDKFINAMATRVNEWYGLHFPELLQIIQDNISICKIISDIGRRDEFTKDRLSERGLSSKKVEAILSVVERSKGGAISDKDLERLRSIARIVIELVNERERLNDYIEQEMKSVAPNVTAVAGATIGARLMAKAGGLDRLAILPASTIQVLGAEKALFRALRTGARPPKHGILFQHPDVHGSPKWQRGKIARALANKIAIAARIDYYRGSEETGLKGELAERLEQIRERYTEPPSKDKRKKKGKR